jgi:DNA-binding IclR family transcriptional regulator
VIGVIPRALALLRELGRPPARRHTASELARRTGIPLQTAHRMLTELGHGGLVIQDTTSRAWSLGPLAITLGAAAAEQVGWPGLASDALTRIARESTETAILTVRHGGYATHVEIVESPQPLRLIEHPGMVGPLTVGASRRVILANLPDAERAAVLADLRADGLPVDELRLGRACAVARARGYEVSRGEVTARTVGVSVAILRPARDGPDAETSRLAASAEESTSAETSRLGASAEGSTSARAVASLTVAGPDHRMDHPAIVAAGQLLRREADRLSAAWHTGAKLAGNGDQQD